jgi:hypothetical protein
MHHHDHCIILCISNSRAHTYRMTELEASEVPFEQEPDVAAEDHGVEGQEEAVPEDLTNTSSTSFPDQGKPRCINSI